VVNIGHPDVRPIADLAELIRQRLDAPKDLVKVSTLPDRMTLVKNPTLERMRTILGVEPKVDLETGVDLVCSRIRARLQTAGAFAL
uniref:hypothetical protein n=1 Tax=Acinetobacter pittii TaxID=48296 RepID=UPI001BDBA79A